MSGHAGTTNSGQAETVGEIVTTLLRGAEPDRKIPALLDRNDVAVYVAFRQAGHKLTEAWSARGDGMAALRAALAEAQGALGSQARADVIELVVASDFEPVPFEQVRTRFSNLERGVSGIELQYGNDVVRHGPTEMIATNRSFSRVIERFAERHGIAEPARAKGLRLFRFAAEQFLVFPNETPAARRMYRGNEVIERSEVTRTAAEGLAQRMTAWMVGNVRDEGRMTYKYWPSSGKESSGNNMIRQWMASLCLVRLARFHDDPALAALADRNIRYNLEHFYRRMTDLGAIEFAGKPSWAR